MAKEKAALFFTPAFVLGYCEALWTPVQGKNEAGEPSGEPKYGVKAIWDLAKFTDREKALWADILGELNRVSQIKFKKDWDKLPANIRRGLRDGAEDEEYVGAGKMFANLSSQFPIGVINLAGEEISVEKGNTSQIYNGSICRGQVSVYGYDKGKGRGVAIGIRNLQKLMDGKRLGGAQGAAEAFKEAEIDEDYARALAEQFEDSAL